MQAPQWHAIFTAVATLSLLLGWFASGSVASIEAELGEAQAPACVEVRWAGSAELGFPVIIPIGEEPLLGGGGLPAVAHVGPYAGMISSIVLSEHRPGDGTVRYETTHYFEEDRSGEAFWTEDRAVCSPRGTDSSTCLLDIRMRVVGGTGKFTDARGWLHSRGLMTLRDPEANPFGSVEMNLTGQVCGDGL